MMTDTCAMVPRLFEEKERAPFLALVSRRLRACRQDAFAAGIWGAPSRELRASRIIDNGIPYPSLTCSIVSNSEIEQFAQPPKWKFAKTALAPGCRANASPTVRSW